MFAQTEGQVNVDGVLFDLWQTKGHIDVVEQDCNKQQLATDLKDDFNNE